MNPKPIPAIVALVLASLAAFGARASDQNADAAPSLPFEEGEAIGYDEIERLRDFVPAQFWENREFFLYEGMKIEVGPTQRDYSESSAYQAATERFQKGVSIGRDGALVGYVSPMEFEIAHARRTAGA